MYGIVKNMPKINFKKLLLNIAFFFIIFVVFFILIEGFLSLLNLGPTKKFYGWGYNPKCCGDLRPSLEFISQVSQEHPYLIKTNSLGLRNNKKTNLTPDKNKLRILAIGDSFTFGPYVSNQETWPTYLEKSFGKNTEVLNAGIAGYSIKEELAYLKEKGVKLKPNLIILQVLANDITDLEKNKSRKVRESALSSTGPLYSFFNFLRDKSHLFALFLDLQLKKEVEKTTINLEQTKRQEDKIKYQKPNNALFDDYKNIFKEFVETSRQKNIKLIVLIIPEYKQIINPDLNQSNQFFEQICQENNIPFINLYKPFTDYDNADIIYLTPWNEHLSKHGNKLVAQELIKFIENNKILKESEKND
jgi:lysophospholipase L1-like esterase